MTRAELVEKIARAMRVDADFRDDWADADDALRQAWLSSATAALAAIEAAGCVVVEREEVERVADWFHDYAEGHTAQGKHDKAERNALRRDFVKAWLAASPLAQEAARDD